MGDWVNDWVRERIRKWTIERVYEWESEWMREWVREKELENKRLTTVSLSWSHREPMMKATSRPSSNQPMDSSGHRVRKCRTSSRCSGHSPDTEMKAGERVRMCMNRLIKLISWDPATLLSLQQYNKWKNYVVKFDFLKTGQISLEEIHDLFKRVAFGESDGAGIE